MAEMSIWELLECVKINLENYKKTMNPAFFQLATDQLDMAIQKAEKEAKNET